MSVYSDKANQAGNLIGVFEGDAEVSYFYLYDTRNQPGQRIVGALQVLSGEPDFSEDDVFVQWSLGEEKVGVFIRNKLWAYFDLRSARGVTGSYPKEPLNWA